MNTQATLEKMNQMRLLGMREHYHQCLSQHLHQDQTIDEFLAQLIDAEWEQRHNRKIQNLLKRAGISQNISPLAIDYTSNRNLDKTVYERLLSLQFMKEYENVIITGPTGIGKSYLAQALGKAACQSLYKTTYYNCGKLMEHIKLVKLDGTYLKWLNKVKKIDLLIIDDFGLHNFDQYTRQAFLDIFEDRYDQKSVIISSQIPVKEWHSLIGEGTIADAILDRIAFSSHRVELQGESLRKNKNLKG